SIPALSMSGSSFLVAVNALLLKRLRLPRSLAVPPQGEPAPQPEPSPPLTHCPPPASRPRAAGRGPNVRAPPARQPENLRVTGIGSLGEHLVRIGRNSP